jgi:phosphate-selective porin OprO and OprP
MRTTLRRGALLVAAALLALVSVESAQAQIAYTANTIQSLYYKEFKKDGRFYVFNDAAAAARFETSSETGVGITKIGIGPNGESVYADNETAMELFLFKYGLSEKVDRPKPPTLAIVWRDGKTRFTIGNNFYLEMSNRIQVRYTHELPDDSIKLAGTENAGDSKGSFTIRRAKFKLEGWMFRPDIEFELQLNWPDASTAQPNRFLEDANIDWDLTHKKAFRIRFGQYKAPYGRQQLTSSGAQQFVDRAITDGRYNPARETGLALWGTLGGNKLEYRAMVSNGNGRSQATNDNDQFLWSGRIQWQVLGNTRMNQWTSGAFYTEGDLGDSDAGTLLAIAANALKNDLRTFPTPAATQNDNTQWGADAILKTHGFAAQFEYHDRKSKPYLGTVAGPEFKDKGYLAQASYAFKVPKLGPGPGYLELAGRYAEIDPSDLRGGDKQKEIGGALSWYYSKHPFKLQADYRQLENEAANNNLGTTSKEFRVQMQFIF